MSEKIKIKAITIKTNFDNEDKSIVKHAIKMIGGDFRLLSLTHDVKKDLTLYTLINSSCYDEANNQLHGVDLSEKAITIDDMRIFIVNNTIEEFYHNITVSYPFYSAYYRDGLSYVSMSSKKCATCATGAYGIQIEDLLSIGSVNINYIIKAKIYQKTVFNYHLNTIKAENKKDIFVACKAIAESKLK